MGTKFINQIAKPMMGIRPEAEINILSMSDDIQTCVYY